MQSLQGGSLLSAATAEQTVWLFACKLWNILSPITRMSWLSSHG
jgi:hypothetical protein